MLNLKGEKTAVFVNQATILDLDLGTDENRQHCRLYIISLDRCSSISTAERYRLPCSGILNNV